MRVPRRRPARTLVAGALIATISLLAAPLALADGDGGGGGGGGGSNPFAGLPAAVMTCIQKALTPAELSQAMTDPSLLSPAAQAKGVACINSGGVTSSSKTASKGAWIVANPVDLAHVTAMSMFRSCAGHDYSGRNILGQTEADRSMKHYLVTDVAWADAGAIKAYAPFDGVVSFAPEQSGIGQQMKIFNKTYGWSFVLFHVKPTVAQGAKVKAGRQVATWPGDHTDESIANATPTVSFDFALLGANGALESPFLHMTKKAAAPYAALGFTAKTLIIPKATRDAAPCNGVWSDTPGGSGYLDADAHI